MTEPVTAKREQVSKKDDKEDNASVQEIMVRSNNLSFPSPFWTFGDYITTRRWSIFDVAGRRRRICETQGSPHEEGVLYALGFKVGTSLKVLESNDSFLFFVKYSSLRFCANMITLSVAGFYKAFGQSFISDDHFLSLVGAVSGIQKTIIQMFWECSYFYIFATLGQ